MILYLSNGPIPKKILHGGQLRLYGLASAVSGIPGHRIVTAFTYTRFPIANLPLLRLLTISLVLILDRSKNVLVSYPNFPFFLIELRQRFGISTALLLLLEVLKRVKKLRILVDADDLPGLEATVYSKQDRRGRVNKKHATLFEKHLFQLADVIWVISEAEGEWIQKTYGIHKEKFLVVRNGNLRSDLTPRDLPKDKIKFAHAGSLFRDRDETRYLLDTFRDLNDQHLEIYVMGYGGEWISREYHSPNIKYLGSLTHEQAEQYVRACDVGILPYSSQEEFFNIMCFPVRLALYITAEVPILSLDSPAIKAFIEHHKIGLTCGFDSFRDAVLKIAGDPALRQRLKANCRKIKDDYYLDAIFQKALSLSLKSDL